MKPVHVHCYSGRGYADRPVFFTLEGVTYSVHGVEKEWPMYRALPGMIGQKTSVENLYNVGDGVMPPVPLGLPGCAASARIVVDDIKQRVKPAA